VNATLADNSGNVARASDIRAVYATPEIEYVITTPNPVFEPGHVAEFDATVHNLSGSNQFVRLDFTVPEFTTYFGQPPGTSNFVSVGNLLPGASHTFRLLFNVAGGNMAPPAGTVITLNLIDTARAGSVSLTIRDSVVTPTPTPRPTPPGTTAVVADFNGDTHPDWVVRNINTRQTVVVNLNDNVVVGAALGPTIPNSRALIGAADFNVDTHPDYALFAPNTFQTAIWYLSGPTPIPPIGIASGPTLPVGWELVTTADFNGDNHPDFVIFKRSTRQTVVVFLDNNMVIGAALLPTLPAGWELVAVADFNSDGHVDIALFNSATRQTVIGYLSGATLIGAALGPTLPVNWQLVAAADFNGDGHPDYLLYRPDTRQTAIWHLNINVFVNSVSGLTLPPGWTLLSH
jgi:hypothetical protein